MIRMGMNDHNANRNGLTEHVVASSMHSAEILRDIKKYRMTYEQAGHIFRALQFIPDALKYAQLTEVDEMRLIPPDKNMRFDEWLDFNSHKLQLFDTPKKIVFVQSSGFVNTSKWSDEIAINQNLDKYEYMEEL